MIQRCRSRPFIAIFLVTFGVCLSASAPRSAHLSAVRARQGAGVYSVPFTATIRSLPGRRSGRAGRYRGTSPTRALPTHRPRAHAQVPRANPTLRRGRSALSRERAPRRRPRHRGRRGRGRGGARGARRRQHSRPGEDTRRTGAKRGHRVPTCKGKQQKLRRLEPSLAANIPFY